MEHPDDRPEGAQGGNGKRLRFSVTEEEARLIFRGLGKLPFEEVYELVARLNRQANEQYAGPSQEEGSRR